MAMPEATAAAASERSFPRTRHRLDDFEAYQTFRYYKDVVEKEGGDYEVETGSDPEVIRRVWNCDFCRKVLWRRDKFKRCGLCGCVAYCNRACQRKAMQQHSDLCVEMQCLLSTIDWSDTPSAWVADEVYLDDGAFSYKMAVNCRPDYYGIWLPTRVRLSHVEEGIYNALPESGLSSAYIRWLRKQDQKIVVPTREVHPLEFCYYYGMRRAIDTLRALQQTGRPPINWFNPTPPKSLSINCRLLSGATKRFNRLCYSTYVGDLKVAAYEWVVAGTSTSDRDDYACVKGRFVYGSEMMKTYYRPLDKSHGRHIPFMMNKIKRDARIEVVLVFRDTVLLNDIATLSQNGMTDDDDVQVLMVETKGDVV